jgi:hypothetical protein
MVVDVDHSKLGRIKTFNLPIKFFTGVCFASALRRVRLLPRCYDGRRDADGEGMRS